MLTFSSYAGLTRRAAQWLAALPSGSDAVIVAPTRGAADEFARTASSAGRAGLHRYSLMQLAADLASREMAVRGLAPVSRLGAEALAARAVHVLSRQRRLGYFAPVAGAPGFARALAATLDELRLNGTDRKKLAATGEPGADLSRLLAVYQREMADRALTDRAGLLEMAAQAVTSKSHRLAGLPLAWLDVPLETRAEQRLADALAAETADAFIATLGEGESEEDAGDGALGRVRRFLFSSEKPPAMGTDDTVEIFAAPGEGLECVEIARRIRRMAGDGTPFDRIAILLRNPERYQPLVEEALRRAGIPAWLSRGSARPDPSGRAFLALLECAAENFSATGFAEYLSLAQVPPLDASGAPLVAEPEWIPADDEIVAGLGANGGARAENPAQEMPPSFPIGWEKLLVDAAVVGGRDRWARRLNGLEEEFREQLRDDEDDRIRQKIDRLGQLRRFALPLIDALAGLPAEAPWGAWLEKLGRLAAFALRRPETVLATLAELEPMSEVGPAGLEEVAGVLSARLRFLRSDPAARRYGQVFVGTPEEARGRVFDAVFLPGLSEGLFPRRSLEDPLLLDHYRKTIGGLPLQDDRVSRERVLLRIAVAAASRRLSVSYPSVDIAQGRQRVPSFYALEVVRAAEGVLPDLETLRRRAAQSSPARLGWPAPLKRADALDDTEYDLAMLDAALRLPKDAARSQGAYLVQASPVLTRSLRTRWRRWSRVWHPADGVVDLDEATRRLLAEQRLERRAWSASSLQHYAACPYRFLLHGVHQLRPREESTPLESMDPLTRGALFHAVQFALLTDLRQRKRLPLAAGKLAEALDLADRVLNRVAAEYEERFAPAIARVWRTEVEDLRTDLRGWLQQMAAQPEWEPVHFEFSFGLGGGRGRDPASLPDDAAIPRARLKGAIDLIERHRVEGCLRITDHKTGKPPQQEPVYVGGGAFLQPMLYGLAAEALLGAKVASSRLSYCTQRGNYSQFEIPLSDRARGFAGRVLGIIDEALAEGFLPAAPARDACQFCDFHAVCGPYEETRTQRKPRERLEPLVELRGMP